MKKILLFLNVSLILILTFSTSVSAQSYNYSPLNDVIYSAEAMNVVYVIDSSNLVDENNNPVDFSFGELVDVFGFEDKIYIVDQSNSCVYVLNSDYQFLATFGNEGEGMLNSPNGIYVTEDAIYVADSDNYRVAIYNHDYQFVKEITAPDDPTFKQSEDDPDGYDFKPLKIAVYKTGRIYVIADQIFEGILDFNEDGSFSRYVGANSVTLSVWDAFWLKFTTEEQRKSQGYKLVSTIVNINIDEMGYLYTISGVEEGDQVIKKLNYKGIDVLSRNGYVPQNGDQVTLPDESTLPDGASQFIDIDMNDYGSYTVLDGVRGRIFTYDFEGNLLYVAGRLSTLSQEAANQKDDFLNPTALTYFQDYILVTDSMNKNLVVFAYTEFGKLVNQATQLYYDGDYEAAKEVWEEVLVLNTNYYLAYAGIAKAEWRNGNYENAMKYAKLGYDDETYSNAYKHYRYEQLVVVFPYIIGAAMVLLIGMFSLHLKKSLNEAKEDDDIE